MVDSREYSHRLYNELKAGRPGALQNAALLAKVPVVTICNMGRVSQTAAQVLQARGLEALYLEGGMKSWSLAWNTAEVPVRDDRIRIIQIRRTGKGCLSYLVGSKQRVHFPFTPIAPGAIVSIGEATLTALRSPGHILESTAYVLNGEALFTGDTLFLSGVGRPDLHADADSARERAQLLYHTLNQLLALGPDVLVLPAHASEPIAFDGVPLVARLGEVGGRLRDWLSSEDVFVERILKRIPPTPPNYARIVELNEAGVLPEGDPTDLEAGANRCAVSS